MQNAGSVSGSGVVLAGCVVMASFVGCVHASPTPAAGQRAPSSTGGAVRMPAPDVSLDSFDGPECQSPGPTVDATPVHFSFCGRKPPMGCQVYDLHIRNQGSDAWLFVDGSGTFPLMTSTLVVDRNLSEPSVYRWSFEGQSAVLPAKMDDISFGEFTAFYVGRGSDVTIKDVMIPMSGKDPTASLRFVDRLLIERRWATDWLGHDATLPLKGEATLERDWERVIHREVGYPERAVAELHVLCVQRVPTSRSVAPDRGSTAAP
jgi:hypothetical protein